MPHIPADAVVSVPGFEGSGALALLRSQFSSQTQKSRLERSRGQYPGKLSIITIEHGSTPRITVAGMSLQRRHVNQHRVACPVAHVLVCAPLPSWNHEAVLQDIGAAPASQKKTKDTASGSSAASQDTSWKHFKDVEREASDSFWYLAACYFCADRLCLKTGRARAHSGCMTGQNVRICSRIPPEIGHQFLLSAYYRRHGAPPRHVMHCGMPSHRAT